MPQKHNNNTTSSKQGPRGANNRAGGGNQKKRVWVPKGQNPQSQSTRAVANDGYTAAQKTKDRKEVAQLADPYYQKTRPSEADVVAKLAGGHGQDLRSASHIIPQLSSVLEPNSTNQVSVVAQTDPGTLFAAAVGLAVQLVKRGASTTLQAASGQVNPWIAAQAFQQMLINIQGGVYPEAINLPGWMWDMFQGMVPKNVNFKTGKMNVSWLTLTTPPVYGNGVVVMNQNGYEYATVFGYQSTGIIINEYTTILADSPITSQAAGVTALQKLLAALPQDRPSQQLVLQPKPVAYIKEDVSSMAMCFPEIGSSGLCDTGGLAVTAYSEKKINMPLFSHFAPYQGDVNNYRGTWEYRKTGGSPVYLIGRAWECSTKNEWTNKLSPFIKFYNFDEYWIQLNLILAGALSQAPLSEQPCPLTAQQVQILLRQELLRCFSNDLAFDLRCDDLPFVPIIPFQVGNNGAPSANSGMRLPRFFFESVRSVKRHTCELANGQLVDYIPVLGRPNPNNIAQLGGFSYTPAGSTSVLPIFAPVGTETFVDLIDLHAIYSSTTQYLVIGGTEYAKELTIWNDWISGLQQNLTGLGVIGSEAGIAALWTPIWSTQQLYVVDPTPSAVTNQARTSSLATRQSSRKEIRVGLSMPKVSVSAPVPDPNSSLYDTSVFLIRDSCVSPIYTASWKYQSCFVKPAWMYTISNNEASDSMLRTLYCEPNVIQSGVTMPAGNQIGAYPSVYSRCARAAEFDVKATFQSGTLNEMETDFNSLAEKGRGGFFTGLASMFGRAIGVPAISDAADAIGRVVDV